MSKKFLITEEEKKHILKQYGLLTEENTEPTPIRMKNLFDNGLYKNFTPSSKKFLDSELAKAYQYIKNNKGGFPYIKIRAGESQVTNKDNEVNPPKEVPPGFLSKERAKTMKTYLTSYFNNLVSSGLLTTKPIFEPIETVIGSKPYKQGVDKPDDTKYDEEKFVEVYITLKAPYQCIVGLTVEVRYVKTPGGTGSDGQPLKCRGGHICDAAKFDVKLNGVKIGTADLNNGSNGGDRTSGPLQITDALAKSIIGDTSKNIVISLQCMSGTKCHSSTPEIEIKKGETVIYHQCAPAISQYGDTNEMMVLELDNCGNLIKQSNKDATNTAVTEKSSWVTKTQVPFDINTIKDKIKYVQPDNLSDYSGLIIADIHYGKLEHPPVGEIIKNGLKYNVYKVKYNHEPWGYDLNPGDYVVYLDGPRSKHDETNQQRDERKKKEQELLKSK
jgi:hypothetical protein